MPRTLAYSFPGTSSIHEVPRPDSVCTQQFGLDSDGSSRGGSAATSVPQGGFRHGLPAISPGPADSDDVVPAGPTDSDAEAVQLLRLNYRNLGLGAHIQYTLENIQKKKRELWAERRQTLNEVPSTLL